MTASVIIGVSLMLSCTRNNSRLNHIEEKLEKNAAECTEKCNAVSNKILDVHARLEENVEMLRNEMSALAEEAHMLRDAEPTAHCTSCDKFEERMIVSVILFWRVYR